MWCSGSLEPFSGLAALPPMLCGHLYWNSVFFKAFSLLLFSYASLTVEDFYKLITLFYCHTKLVYKFLKQLYQVYMAIYSHVTVDFNHIFIPHYMVLGRGNKISNSCFAFNIKEKSICFSLTKMLLTVHFCFFINWFNILNILIIFIINLCCILSNTISISIKKITYFCYSAHKMSNTDFQAILKSL